MTASTGTPLPEVSPSTDWSQRWRGGRHSWRHKSEGGFDQSRYDVEPIDETTAKSYVTRHHYSGSYPAARLRYGLFEDGRLTGVCVLGVPASAKVLTGPFPTLEPYTEALSLDRLVLADSAPGCSESWFVARVFRLAAGEGVRGVVSFADPVPRRLTDGTLLFPGHVGTIYQALNARLAGRGTARTLTVLPDGTVLNARAMQKVRSQERGHEHVERKLIALGARAPRAGENPARWLADAIDRVSAVRLRHRGCWRYCFAVGTPAQRRKLHIALPAGPYPKQPDEEAA